MRGGDVVAADDPDSAGVRRYLEMAVSDRGQLTSVLQTVGSKGHDGFALSVVVG